MGGPEHFRPHIHGSLRKAYETFEELDDRGVSAFVVNRSVDFSTRADKAISRAIHEYFESRSDSYTLLSEEGGVETTKEATKTVIVDELDGTANLMSGGDVPFGPIIAIAPRADPSFEDISSMGFLNIPTGDLYEAHRDSGASLTAGWADGSANSRPLTTTGRSNLEGDIPPNILVDQYMLGRRPGLAKLLWSTGYPGDFRSWAYHMALVARGGYDLAITGDYSALSTDKRATAEELAGGYLLIKEAGGHIMTWNGESLGPKAIGMEDGTTFDVIAAASEPLAQSISARVTDFLD